ncbi:hypothetical protein [Corynebacterium oculi]|uniref:hypothetical protein n=1 Tax=Corynebacterium oculi TaxID=1544416 RepID=UPI00123724D0|nr:hypothetical protein [Corynebacterium oculi]
MKKIFGSILVAGTFFSTVPAVVVAQAGEVPPAGTVRDCRHTAFTQEGWKDFEQAKKYLAERFEGPKEKSHSFGLRIMRMRYGIYSVKLLALKPGLIRMVPR